MPGTLVERGWLILFLVTFIFILPHLLNLLSLWIFSPSPTWCPCSQLYLRYNIPPFLDCHKRANQIKPNMTNNKAPRKNFKYKFFFFFNIKVWGDGKDAHHKRNLKWYFRHFGQMGVLPIQVSLPPWHSSLFWRKAKQHGVILTDSCRTGQLPAATDPS